MKKQHLFKIKTYLNASHAIKWNDSEGQLHPHTWEILAAIGTGDYSDFPEHRFTVIENSLNEVLAPFSQKSLNEVKPFDEVNATLENFTKYVFEKGSLALDELDCQLVSLEISESPTRTCVISII